MSHASEYVYICYSANCQTPAKARAEGVYCDYHWDLRGYKEPVTIEAIRRVVREELRAAGKVPV